MKEEYEFPLEDYMSRERFERMKRFAQDKETPCLILDLEVVRSKYEELRKNIPYAKIYYAVKANPNDEVVSLLRDLGSCFDVATRFELDQLIRLGVSPDRMSFGNTIKKEKDIAYFYDNGVRRRLPARLPSPGCSSGYSPKASVPTGRCRENSARIPR
jgi:ornithine decarboxylase